MLLILSALIVAASVIWSARQVVAARQAADVGAERSRVLELFAVFAPAVQAAAGEPRALLVWEPLARTARALFPAEFAELDRASGGSFPFGRERLEAAHAQWTSDWLSWEASHDAEFKLKAAALQQEIEGGPALPSVRARLEAVEREKLEGYQRRYQEYVRVAKALQQLSG